MGVTGHMIRADQITWTLEGNKLLDSCTFNFSRGEFVGVIGPNGAGKSSLLKVLAGIQKPSSGSVSFTGAVEQNLFSVAPELRAKKLGYLAQQERSAWPISVKDLVLLGRLPWRDEKETALLVLQLARVLQATEAHHLVDRLVTTLSGGELQRVLLARLLMGEPELVIADEPIAALDIYHQLQVMELLKGVAKQGKTVVAALHDLSLAARFCDQLVLMNSGKIVAVGQPAEVLTAENLAVVYGISAHVECREDSVLILPVARLTSS